MTTSDEYCGIPPINVTRHPESGPLIVARGLKRFAIDDPRAIAQFHESVGLLRDHIRRVGSCPGEHVDRLAADQALHRADHLGFVRELKGGAP